MSIKSDRWIRQMATEHEMIARLSLVKSAITAMARKS